MNIFYKPLMIIIGIIISLVGVLIVYFNLSYSPLKSTFNRDLKSLIEKSSIENGLISNDDFEKYPNAIKNFVKNSGFIGKSKMSYMNIFFENADFIQDTKKPKLKIDYNQYNFAKNPSRIAFIDSSLYGIPFEGYDGFINAEGRMTGIIAKNITLFNEKGVEMDKASLCTYLAEALFIPTSLLENNIVFEEIDLYNIRATINYNGNSASGIFTFNDKFEMIQFYTKDRAVVKSDGSIEHIPWTARCSQYKIYENGIKLPTILEAVWNYPENDLVYFKGTIKNFEYR